MRASDPRPTTLLWQTASLPPANISYRAEAIARRTVNLDWRDVAGAGGVALNKLLPLRGELARGYARLVTWRCRREMRNIDARSWRNFEWRDLQFLMREADWIRDHAHPDRGWIDHVACSIPTRLDYLQRHGIAARFVPVGYHPIWGDDLNVKRDIDVLFIGVVKCGDRRRFVPHIMRQLRGRGFTVHVVNENCYGRQRTALLNRSRIVLNMVKFPWEFAGMRLLMAIGCRTLVVSNTCSVTRPYQSGLHFVSAEIDDMVDVSDYYLRHEAERREFTQRAFDAVSRDLTMEQTAEQLLRVGRQLKSAA